MSAGIKPVPGWLSFRRIADVPFQTCVATLDRWQRTGHGGELRAGPSLLRGPIEYDSATGTCRIQVRLARGPLRPYQRMRLDIDRWSSSTALELIPCGRVRPTAAYFRAGHLFLDSLIRSLPPSRAPSAQVLPSRVTGQEQKPHSPDTRGERWHIQHDPS